MRSLSTLNTHPRWATPSHVLLRVWLKLTAELWETPEGLHFMQALCRASNHSYGSRPKYPPSPEQL